MRAVVRYSLLAVLVLAVIAALALTVSNPVLYTLEKDTFSSRFHENNELQKIQSLNSTTDVLPLMQDVLDFTGPIVLNVRLRDIEQAQRDLELFSKSHLTLNNLIIRLDMSESDMQGFLQSNARQMQLLQSLMNESVSLDALDRLEIQYRDQNDPNLLISVEYQREAIRKKVHELYEQYGTKTREIAGISTKYNLDTTQGEVSLKEFGLYLQDIDKSQKQLEERNAAIDLPIHQVALLSFLIQPDSGRYGDLIHFFGYYFSPYGFRDLGAPDMPVTVYRDNVPIIATRTDALGSYTATLPVERISAGTHSLHALSGSTLSKVRTLTIIPVSSATTLSVGKADSRGEVPCTGTVIANRPVRSAPVQIIWDQTHVVDTTTDENGEFTAIIRFPNGKHTVIARFTGEGFPVNPSESEARVVDVSIISSITPVADNGLFQYAGSVLIFVLFAAGAVYYLRRMPGAKPFMDWISRDARRPEMTGSVLPVPVSGPVAPEDVQKATDGDTAVPGYEFLFLRYARILQDEGLSAAARIVYLYFAGHIARELHMPSHASLTPREMSGSCTKKAYCGAFSTFVTTYERIRYGGQRSTSVQAEFESVTRATDSQLRGEDH
jgi:hypothetical protein